MKRFALLAWFLAAPAFAHDKAAIVVPFDILKSRHIVVDVTVNGKGPFALIFDTGAPVTLVGTRLAREAKVPTSGGLAALFGNFGMQKVSALELGGVQLDAIDAIVMDHPVVVALASATGKKIDGIVGSNVFGRYKTTIDYQAKTLTFVATDYRPGNMIEALTKMMLANRGVAELAPVIAPKGVLGLRVSKAADDAAPGVLVDSVFPDSPAAKAGLKAGDRLLTLDGRWTDQVNDCFESARTARPGDTVGVEILRDGKKQSLKATVAAGF